MSQGGRRRHPKGEKRRSTTTLFASSCLGCGRRTEDGAALCPKCEPKFGQKRQTEAERMVAQPGRRRYKSHRYQANRARRLQLARFECEWPGCRERIGVEPHDWECDHHVAIVDCQHAPSCSSCRLDDKCPLDDVSNLRCHCLTHHRQKTATDRARRRLGAPERGRA